MLRCIIELRKSAARAATSESAPTETARPRAALAAVRSDVRRLGAAATPEQLVDELEELRKRVMVVLDLAERSGDPKAAIAGIREAHAMLRSIGEVSGAIRAQSTGPTIDARTVVIQRLGELSTDELRRFIESPSAAIEALSAESSA